MTDRKFALMILAGMIALAVFAFYGVRIAEGKTVRWNKSTSSVYDGVALGGVTACKGHRPPWWWRSRYVVAHKTLPCGTKVRFMYRGRKATARVWDRGPYVGGREFDQDRGLANALGFPWSVDSVYWRVVR